MDSEVTDLAGIKTDISTLQVKPSEGQVKHLKMVIKLN